VNIEKSKITGPVNTGRETPDSSVSVGEGVNVAVLVLTSVGACVSVSRGVPGVFSPDSSVGDSCHGKLQACNIIINRIKVKTLIDFFLIFASRDVMPQISLKY
jgi:hypothetical protein